MGEKISKAIIFAGGEIKNYDKIRRFLKDDEYIICADSGYHHCQKLGIVPDLLVGDFDSIGVLPQQIPTVCFPAEKNYSDTTMAIEEAKKRGAKMLMLIGMLGGRIDHSLANIQTMFDSVKDGYIVCIQDGESELYPYFSPQESVPQEIILAPRPDSYFSLLSFSDSCQNVTIEGGKYPLHHYTLKNTQARAISNEFLDRPVKISFHSGMLLVVICPKKETPLG